jgi:spermidine synthase
MLALGSAAARARIVPGSILLPALAIALAAFAVSPLGSRAEEATARLRFAGLVPGVPLLAWDDTPTQHLMIAGGATRHVYAGGQYAGSFPDPAEHEAQAHVLMSLAPRPRTILLAGGGLEGTLRFLLAHPVERIDVVVADPEALLFLRGFLPPEDRRALDDARVRLVADDPRRFLARPPGGARGPAPAYDLMLILEPPPVTLLLARLTTVEFYRLAAARLAADGALVISLETAPNVLTGETAALAGSIAGALRTAFPVVRATPGPASLLIAGTDAGAVTLDPEVLADRHLGSGVVSEVFAPEVFATLFPAERVADVEAAVALAAARVPASRDTRPVSFLHALARRRSLAGGGAPDRGGATARLAAGLARRSPAAIAAAALVPSLLALVVIGARRRRSGGAPLAAAHAVVVTGACGMAWSLLILFSYQARAGALYGRIGLLTALFMLGLAIGGLATTRAAEAGAATAHRTLAGTAAAAFLFALVVPAALGGAIPGARAPAGLAADLLHGVLLLAGGLVTGALFPAAAGVLLAARPDPRVTAADLEAADHAGAAVAALAAGVVLVPVLGLAGTAWLLAALQGAALAGVLLVTGRPRSPGSPGGTSGTGRP